MARATRLPEQVPAINTRQPVPAAEPAPHSQAQAAAGRKQETKPPGALWTDGLGRVGIRSAQVLLILTLAVVSVYALMQIKLLAIPVLIALILAAAIGPFVNLLRRRGIPGGVATGIASVIYFSVRSQWGELAAQASSGVDEVEHFLLTGPVPIEQEQLDQARE